MIDLTNQDIFQAMQTEGEDVVAADDGRRALIFVRNMSTALAAPENKNLEAGPDMLAVYQSLIDRLSLVALSNLKETEATQIFQNKILLGLREDNINFVKKIKARLIAIPDFAGRDMARKQLREALLGNEEQLGTNQIAVASGPVAPTLGNWLKKYNERFGMVAVNAVARNEFLTTDPDVQRLNDDDKKALRKLLELYDYLKLSSQTPEGLEDPVLFDFGGQRKILRSGEFEDVVLPPPVEKMLDEIFNIYEAEPGSAEAVSGAIASESAAPVLSRSLAYDKALAATRTMLAQSQGDAKKLFDMLFDSLSRSAAEETVAGLLLLAQLRKLDDILAEDERFRNLVIADLKKSGQDDKVEGFRINPTAPNFIARLLKVALEDKLGIALVDALAFGERLGKMLSVESDKYSRIVIRGGDGGGRWNL